MGLVDLIRERVQGPPKLSVETMRKAKPVRHPDVKWEENEDGAVRLQAPLEGQGRGFAAMLARRMNLPATKGFELEPIGGFVWLQCDGATTVETIGKRLRERYKMNRVEADVALGAFLQTLGQRRLIVLTVGKRDVKGNRDKDGEN